MTKFIKRVLSLVVLVAMLATLFCGFPVTAEEAAEETEVVRDITQKEEEFLLYLGILKTPGPHQEAETTRSGLAQLASRVAKLPEYTGNDKFFTDVPENHKHYKEIYAMASAGILNGDGNGKFRPDDPVSPNEICKVLLVILGYDVVGYYDDYMVIANRIGLTEGVEFDGNIRVGQMLRMILTTFDLPMMEQVTYGERDEHKVQDGYTALECYHGLVKQRGVVTGTNGTRLTDVDISIGANQLIIGNQVYQYKDTKDLLGREVVYYSERDKVTGGTKQQIGFLYEDTARNHYFTLDGKDIIDFNEDRLEYYVGSKKKSVQVSRTLDVIFNGIAYPEYTIADLKPACGSVTLLDNDDDRIYEVALVEEVIFMMVDSVDKESGIIYGRYPAISVGSSTQDEKYQVYMEAGITGELSFLIPGDVIAVQASKNQTGSKIITVNYLGEGTSGVLEGVYKDTYTIDGVPYEITDATVLDGDPYLLGQTVTLYTFNDYCAGVIHPKNDNYKFGYLIDANVKESAFSGTLQVRIVNQNRELMELTTDKNFMLDESKYTDAFRAFDQIQAAADKRVFSPDMQSALEATSASNVPRTDVKTLYNDGAITQLKQGDDNFPLSQPVRYRINDEGILSHLDTIIKSANETEHSLTPFQTDGGTVRAELEASMYSSNDRGFYIYDGKGNVFANLISTENVIMPPYDQRDKVEYYGTGSITNEQYCAVEAYTVNDYRQARYAVVYNKVHSTVYAENGIYIVGDLEKVLDEDGEIVRKIVLLGYNGPYTLILSDEIADADVAVGNVVRYQLNTDNKVTHVEVYYNIADGDPAAANRIKESGQTRAWGLRNRMAYGTVLAFGDSFISHTTSTDKEVYKKENLRNYRAASTSFYRYSEEGGSPKVEMVSSGDLVPYDVDPKTTQKTIVITYSNRLDVVYIIDKK